MSVIDLEDPKYCSDTQNVWSVVGIGSLVFYSIPLLSDVFYSWNVLRLFQEVFVTNIATPTAFYALQSDDFPVMGEVTKNLQDICNSKPGLQKVPDKGKVGF